MFASLNPAIEMTVKSAEEFEFHDRRTGFRITTTTPAPVAGVREAELSVDTLRSLGFVGDLTTAKIRELQRPIRDRLQLALREQELRDILGYAVAHVPYYRTAANVYGLALDADTDIILYLPVLGRQDVRRNAEALVSEERDVRSGLASGRLSIARTSGTTGERIQVLSDMSLSRVPPNYEEVWQLQHGDKVPKTAVLTTPICSATECRLARIIHQARSCGWRARPSR